MNMAMRSPRLVYLRDRAVTTRRPSASRRRGSSRRSVMVQSAWRRSADSTPNSGWLLT